MLLFPSLFQGTFVSLPSYLERNLPHSSQNIFIVYYNRNFLLISNRSILFLFSGKLSVVSFVVKFLRLNTFSSYLARQDILVFCAHSRPSFPSSSLSTTSTLPSDPFLTLSYTYDTILEV